jgi:metal-responsive CopG/Arc/MetJ family transcriptional regulator
VFFAIRFERHLVDRIDDVWPRLGFFSRIDLIRKALHDYLRQAGEHEAAAIFEPWLAMYDDTTPTGQ